MARRTKEDAQATRTALLDAAEHVFLQCGVARTSLAEIAQAAGLTRGAIYWHFKDKSDLFMAMLERVTLPLEAELIALTGNSLEGTDAIALLRQRAKDALHKIVHDDQTGRVAEIATLMVEMVDDLAPLRVRCAQGVQDNVARIASVLTKAAQQRGVRLPQRASVLARGLDAMIGGLVHSWLLQRSFDLEMVAGHALDAFLRGIGLPPLPDQG
ncbi:MAG: TetR family transcriptional regulator [Ottowia sp.]|nr:TetR family transcriptional regulator [Ottowia sp.]